MKSLKKQFSDKIQTKNPFLKNPPVKLSLNPSKNHQKYPQNMLKRPLELKN